LKALESTETALAGGVVPAAAINAAPPVLGLPTETLLAFVLMYIPPLKKIKR
jgi:hypothetical protein